MQEVRSSTLLCSTSLRQGFGWQAEVLAKAARRSLKGEGGLRLYGIIAMHYVYLLQSINHPDQTYVGLTSDLKKRLRKHNYGEVPHSSKYKPWNLVSYTAFQTRDQAASFEAYLKTGSGRAFAKRRLW